MRRLTSLANWQLFLKARRFFCVFHALSVAVGKFYSSLTLHVVWKRNKNVLEQIFALLVIRRYRLISTVEDFFLVLYKVRLNVKSHSLILCYLILLVKKHPVWNYWFAPGNPFFKKLLEKYLLR